MICQPVSPLNRSMNIFYLDSDIERVVQFHCDSHVVKMCLETAQILCTALHRYDQPAQ